MPIPGGLGATGIAPEREKIVCMKRTDPMDALAGFDSGTTMLDSLKHSLGGRPFSGSVPGRYIPDGIIRSINALPEELRQWMYRMAGKMDALQEKNLGSIDMEAIAAEIVSGYPDRKFPAIVFGSANGALLHLCGALGIPWLPQTVLITTQRSIEPDDIQGDMQWGELAMRRFLANNPDVVVHQMHDPVQDRLMVAKVGYCRVKYLHLPRAYRDFLQQRLEPGGVVIVSDCRLQWPVMKLGDRHFFQVGGYGTTTPDEYLHGSERVRAFLKEQKSSLDKWDVPEPDSGQSEAEWGFVESLADDLTAAAAPMYRLSYESPEDLSGLAADCYRWWYSRRGYTPDTLLVDCFANIDPFTTMQARAVPFWLVFNTSVSAENLRAFCRGVKMRRVRIILMANGITGIGSLSLDQWREAVAGVSQDIQFVGVHPDAYPNDPVSFGAYGKDLRNKLSPLHAPPRLMQMEECMEFMNGKNDAYPLTWQRGERFTG